MFTIIMSILSVDCISILYSSSAVYLCSCYSEHISLPSIFVSLVFVVSIPQLQNRSLCCFLALPPVQFQDEARLCASDGKAVS